MAFALPRINLIHPGKIGQPTKQAAFADTWEETGMPATVAVNEIDRGICRALSASPRQLVHVAQTLVERYRNGFAAICASLE